MRQHFGYFTIMALLAIIFPLSLRADPFTCPMPFLPDENRELDTFETSAYTNDVAVGDFTGDGRAEVITIYSKGHVYSIWKNFEPRSRKPEFNEISRGLIPLPYVVPGYSRVLVEDFDNDGKNDFVIYDIYNKLSGSKKGIFFYHNQGLSSTGEPLFRSSQVIFEFDRIQHAAFRVVNGRKQLLVSGEKATGTGIYAFHLQSDGEFSEAGIISPDRGKFLIHDFNRDGVSDILATNTTTKLYLMSDESKILQTINIQPAYWFSVDSSLADVDGDGDKDLALLHGEQFSIVKFQASRTGITWKAGPKVKTGLPFGAHRVYGVNLDGDRYEELVFLRRTEDVNISIMDTIALMPRQVLKFQYGPVKGEEMDFLDVTNDNLPEMFFVDYDVNVNKRGFMYSTNKCQLANYPYGY